MLHLKTLLIVLIFPVLAFAAPEVPTGLDHATPEWTDEQIGESWIHDNDTESWRVAAWLGNIGASNIWHDGPRLEVGGLHVPQGCIQGDGKVYCSYTHDYESRKNVIEVDETTGEARMLMFREGAYTGDISDVQGGMPFYGHDTLYVLGPNCVRKISGTEGSRTVSIVAGECGRAGTADGIGDAARFGVINGQVASSDGDIYIIESVPGQLRRITPDGLVSTLQVTRPEVSPVWGFTGYRYELMSEGENSDTMYLADDYNTGSGYTVSKITLSTDRTSAVLTRHAGVLNTSDRSGKNIDGPALTYASVYGGMDGTFSPFYGNFFLNGVDNKFARRVTDDGWVRTYSQRLRPGTPEPSISASLIMGEVSGEAVFERLIGGAHAIHIGMDDRGGVYMRRSRDKNLIFRSYNPAEGGTE